MDAGQITVDVIPRLVTGSHATGCDHGPDCLDCTPDFATLILATLILAAILDGNDRLARMEQLLMTDMTEQQHLDNDVNSLRTEWAAGVTELKNQIAMGVPAAELDFSNLDQLTGDVKAETEADAPVAPPAEPAPAEPTTTDAPPAPAPVDEPPASA